MNAVDLSVDNWIICIAGFLQKFGDIIGVVKLQRMLQIELGGGRTEIVLRRWDDDMSALAQLIWRLRPKSKPRIAIFCYSWGATAAMILAHELRRLGFTVDVIVSSDGVHRHRYVAGNWRALYKNSRLKVPDNVRDVYWFNQENPVIDFSRQWSRVVEPAGHEFVAVDETKTRICHAGVLTASHEAMDDADEFHELALAEARKMLAA